MRYFLLLSLLFSFISQLHAQQIVFPKDSIKSGEQQIVYYKMVSSSRSFKKLIVAVQGCYSDGNSFANELSIFANTINADILSIENRQKVFLNTGGIKEIIKKVSAENAYSYTHLYYVGFSCNAAAGIAYGLENELGFAGIIAFMPALDRVPFSYYNFNKQFCPIVIITGNKDFGYKAGKTMSSILSKYNKRNILLIDIPGAEHSFTISEKENTLMNAYRFIDKR